MTSYDQSVPQLGQINNNHSGLSGSPTATPPPTTLNPADQVVALKFIQSLLSQAMAVNQFNQSNGHGNPQYP